MWPKKDRRGERNIFAKLTDKKVKSILKENGSNKYVGMKYGVSEATISLIRNNRTWKHIERNSHD